MKKPPVQMQVRPAQSCSPHTAPKQATFKISDILQTLAVAMARVQEEYDYLSDSQKGLAQ